MVILFFIAGLLFLILGAEGLVRGASKIAAAVGISPLIIGLTVVALGTSSPELAISIKSVFSSQGDIALGNIIGSNIFNILLVLGLSAIVAPLMVSTQLIRHDVPLMLGVSILVLVLSLDQSIGRADGLLLVIGLGLYIWFLIRQSRREHPKVQQKYASEYGDGSKNTTSWLLDVIYVSGGLGLLVIGSRWLVDSAVAIAESLNVSELIIGLTIIAGGTSLPEVVTSVIASIRGERDIAVGNVVGSSLFNLMCVLGFAGIFAPTGIDVTPAVLRFDLPILIVVSFACIPIFFTDGAISRWEGLLLVTYYVAYTLYLILAASHHDALPRFSAVMMYFAIPLTLFTLFILAGREYRKRKSKHLE